MPYRRIWLPIAGLILTLSLSRAQETRLGYTGDAGCFACHKDESASYLHTAHHLTSQLPTTRSILGSLTSPSNTLTIIPADNPLKEPALLFKMQAEAGRFTESAFTGFPPDLLQRKEPIDIVTGSGRRGQTYLYWNADLLFELPISFWTDGKRWVNSPGFTNGTADFGRPIQPQCLECHATFIQPLSNDASTNRYNRASFLPGIACETCHGPGAAHAALHVAHPARSTIIADEAIVNPARLSRERQLDLCALCHNGIQRKPLAPAFSYQPGKPLADFYQPIETSQAEHPDVHGHQVALLERSRCFQSSSTMTCSTCHNTHAPERDVAFYSARCLTCHTVTSCKNAIHIGIAAKSECVACHMPVEPTSAIVSETGDQQLHTSMRNHWVKIYPDAHLP